MKTLEIPSHSVQKDLYASKLVKQASQDLAILALNWDKKAGHVKDSTKLLEDLSLTVMKASNAKTLT